MKEFGYAKLEELVASKKFFLAIFSYASILVIFSNLTLVHSPLVGTVASITYLLVNGALLGYIFLEKECTFFRFLFGTLLFIMLLGFVCWLVMIIYNLDILMSVIALCIVSTFSIFVEFKTRHLNGDVNSRTRNQQRAHTRLRFVKFVHLFMVVLSFYLLFVSRAEEVYTVWQVMHPAFMPVFFTTTVLLLAVVFSPERVEWKLLLIVLHSILSHMFFVIILPAGDVLGQQMVLGRTRLVYEK